MKWSEVGESTPMNKWIIVLGMPFLLLIIQAIYLLLWGLGIYYREIILDPSITYLLLSNIFYPLALFNLHALWIIKRENGMEDLFYRAGVTIVIGLFILFIISFQVAI
jgi:hypothetical protein